VDAPLALRDHHPALVTECECERTLHFLALHSRGVARRAGGRARPDHDEVLAEEAACELCDERCHVRLVLVLRPQHAYVDVSPAGGVQGARTRLATASGEGLTWEWRNAEGARAKEILDEWPTAHLLGIVKFANDIGQGLELQTTGFWG
jgi:hypothetical protein